MGAIAFVVCCFLTFVALDQGLIDTIRKHDVFK